MKLLLHDFGGYPFPFELSRYLASQGHHVTHAYFKDLPVCRGNGAGGPGTMVLRELSVGRYRKYNVLTKPLQDTMYGEAVARLIREVTPDIVVSADTPLDAQRRIVRYCTKRKVPFVYWVQDIISTGIGVALRRCGSIVASAVANRYGALEGKLLRSSTAVIVSAEQFLEQLHEWAVAPEKIHVIHNWGCLTDIYPLARENAWSREHLAGGRRRLLYSGTLGLKHEPKTLVALARALPDEIEMVVVAEGPGADWIRAAVRRLDLRNVTLFPFQPYERLPEVLGSADVLLAMLSRDASRFCFPSKVLTYLCAGRPVVALMPRATCVSDVIERAGCGTVIDPADISGAAAAIRELLADRTRCSLLGERARRYACREFQIERIGMRFEDVFRTYISGTRGRPAVALSAAAGSR